MDISRPPLVFYVQYEPRRPEASREHGVWPMVARFWVSPVERGRVSLPGIGVYSKVLSVTHYGYTLEAPAEYAGEILVDATPYL